MLRTELDGWVETIRNPADETARLVFADWLEEKGVTEGAGNLRRWVEIRRRLVEVAGPSSQKKILWTALNDSLRKVNWVAASATTRLMTTVELARAHYDHFPVNWSKIRYDPGWDSKIVISSLLDARVYMELVALKVLPEPYVGLASRLFNNVSMATGSTDAASTLNVSFWSILSPLSQPGDLFRPKSLLYRTIPTGGSAFRGRAQAVVDFMAASKLDNTWPTSRKQQTAG